MNTIDKDNYSCGASQKRQKINIVTKKIVCYVMLEGNTSYGKKKKGKWDKGHSSHFKLLCFKRGLRPALNNLSVVPAQIHQEWLPAITVFII